MPLINTKRLNSYIRELVEHTRAAIREIVTILTHSRKNPLASMLLDPYPNYLIIGKPHPKVESWKRASIVTKSKAS